MSIASIPDPRPGADRSAASEPEASARIATAVAVLRQRFGDRVATGEALRRQHANTLTWIECQPPDAVLFVERAQDVQEVLAIARTHRVPLIPFGAGTSLEGHVNAPAGGISLDFSRMNRLIRVNERDLDCVVEPGISRAALNALLRDTGLFFPVDPGAETATIGGMAATRASGTNAVRYGTMRDNVLNVTAVMADGSVITTGRRARKSAAGYDLTRLLVGSEGTLGIFTELTVRLFGVPEVILAAVCRFRTLEGACNTVIQAIQLGGLGLARVELVDEMQIRAINVHSRMGLAEAPTLFLEFHGSKASAEDGIAQFEALAAEEGAQDYQWAEAEEERRRLWKARHEAYFAVKTAWPGKDVLATDVCVPISRLADCVMATRADIERTGLLAPIVGHAGDGNFHCSVVLDANDPAEKTRVEGFLNRLSQRALDMDGTCTGEHGIGQGKIACMAAEHGPGLATMRQIKQALDPLGILNPGKILPTD
jgi:D-lactate dehydrogenase (cytochrome)